MWLWLTRFTSGVLGTRETWCEVGTTGTRHSLTRDGDTSKSGEQDYMQRMWNSWNPRNPKSRLTTKQPVTQCSKYLDITARDWPEEEGMRTSIRATIQDETTEIQQDIRKYLASFLASAETRGGRERRAGTIMGGQTPGWYVPPAGNSSCWYLLENAWLKDSTEVLIMAARDLALSAGSTHTRLDSRCYYQTVALL